jgi:hypothetical protein
MSSSRSATSQSAASPCLRSLLRCHRPGPALLQVTSVSLRHGRARLAVGRASRGGRAGEKPPGAGGPRTVAPACPTRRSSPRLPPARQHVEARGSADQRAEWLVCLARPHGALQAEAAGPAELRRVAAIIAGRPTGEQILLLRIPRDRRVGRAPRGPAPSPSLPPECRIAAAPETHSGLAFLPTR